MLQSVVRLAFTLVFSVVPWVAHAEPQRWLPELLGQDGRITLSPGFAPDGSFFVLAQSECREIGPCPQRLKRVDRTNDGWLAPELVPQTVQGRVDWPSVTPDGKSLLISWAVPRDRHEGQRVYEDFDLYRLDLDRADAVPQPIDEPDINRIRGGELRKRRFFNNETAPVLTDQGDLYFWTERTDGDGERDIYVARSDGDGGFQAPALLGTPITSAAREDSSWVTRDGSLLLFAKEVDGAGDIFVSLKQADGQWSVPEPLDSSVNSDYAEFAARITPDGQTLVFTSNRPFDDRPPGLLQVWAAPVAEIPVLHRAIRSTVRF